MNSYDLPKSLVFSGRFNKLLIFFYYNYSQCVNIQEKNRLNKSLNYAATCLLCVSILARNIDQTCYPIKYLFMVGTCLQRSIYIYCFFVPLYLQSICIKCCRIEKEALSKVTKISKHCI